jgi:hypothetical protein
MRTLKSLTCAAAAAAMLVASSTAATLPPGSALIPVPSAAEPQGGSVLATLASPFSVPGSFSGTLVTQVIQGDTSNPLGGLTFTYEFNNLNGPNSIGRMSVNNFLGIAMDVGYDSGSAGVAPALADRNPFGDVVGFSFFPFSLDPNTGFMTPGSNTRRLVVQTNAPAYRDAQASLIDGGVTMAATYAAVVPEPASVALGLVGLMAGALFVVRRRA